VSKRRKPNSGRPGGNGELPPGYEWPRVSVVHPEHGAYQFDVHGVRSHKTGTVTLVVFTGVTTQRQGRIVRDLLGGLGDEAVPFDRTDISDDLGIWLAAWFHGHPGATVAIVPEDEWRRWS
jgi:hypothetical protein